MGVYKELNEFPNEVKSNWLEVDLEHQRVRSYLTVFHFEDHGYQICYIPSLNLSSYGDTLDEAKDMLFTTVLDGFNTSLVELSGVALHEELSKYGWVVSGPNVRNFENSAHVDKDGILKNFDLPQDTVIHEGILTA